MAAFGWKRRPSPTRVHVKVKQIFLFVLIVLLAGPVSAAQDLYTGEAPIVDEGEKGQQEAIRNAFRAMLVKLVGVRQRTNAAGLAGEIARAQDYMVSYGFREVGSQGRDARHILVSFDPGRVGSMLKRHGVPVWQVGRPQLLTWVVVDEGGERRLLQPDQDGPLLDLLRDAGEARGLTLVFPLMDLEDRTRVNEEQAWRGLTPEVQAASARYGKGGTLVARLTKAEDGSWSAKWSLSAAGVGDDWSDSGVGLRAVAMAAADRAVEKLARRLAPPMAVAGKGEAEGVMLRIEEIRNRKDFGRINQMLPRLASVTHALVEVAEPEAVIYRLAIKGSQEGLRQELQRSGILRPASGGGVGELRYRLSY
jgi:hypothetical protein